MGFENGHLLRVTLRATAGQLEQVNTFHYDLHDVGIVLPNDPQDLADRFRDDVRPHWQASLTNAWTLDPVHIVDEFDPLNPTAPRSSWDSGAAITGTKAASSDPLPNFCTALVALRTAHIGRRYRGRLWLMGSYQEGEQSGGTWSGGVLTSLQTVVGFVPFEPDIAGPTSDSTAKWCVYSRTQRAANLDPYASPITTATVSPLVHSLRSRAIYS